MGAVCSWAFALRVLESGLTVGLLRRKFQDFMLNHWFSVESHLFLPRLGQWPSPMSFRCIGRKPRTQAPKTQQSKLHWNAPFHAPTPKHWSQMRYKGQPSGQSERRACAAEPSNNLVFFYSGLPRLTTISLWVPIWYIGVRFPKLSYDPFQKMRRG